MTIGPKANVTKDTRRAGSYMISQSMVEKNRALV